MILRPPRATRTDTLFPYTTLFRSAWLALLTAVAALIALATQPFWMPLLHPVGVSGGGIGIAQMAVRLADLDAQVEDLRGQVAAATSAAGAEPASGAERLSNLEKPFGDQTGRESRGGRVGKDG